MEQNKTHYRKVFKSEHLGSADLEEMIEENKSLVFTIDKVTQHVLNHSDKNSGVVVAGKRISANIAYFKEKIKPLVLNATNSKRMVSFSGSKFVEDWAGLTIELYIDENVKMKGETVGGVRIKGQLNWGDLEALFEAKKDVLKADLVANAQRIIEEKDSQSFIKLRNHLSKI